MKHNTAKWLIRPDYGQENVYRLWSKDSNYHKDTSPEVMDGNARLMENAPQLLKAIRTVLARVDHTNKHTSIGEMRDTWDILREAVNRALGKEEVQL